MADIAGKLFYKHWPTQNPLMADEAQDLVRSVVNELLHFHPAEEWHEEMGDVLWWHLPVQEPPYVGSPLDSNWNEVWPFGETAATWYTHFQVIHDVTQH